MYKKNLLVLLTLVLSLSACAPAMTTPEVMMDKPTEAMMATPTAAMMDKPTEAMMETPAGDMMATPTGDMMATPAGDMMATPTGDMMATPAGAMMDAPAWFSAKLNNVHTGQDFSIDDYKGKVVLVEDMAIWCSNCKMQQEQIKALHTALGMDTDLVTLSLDVDPNENAADLKTYAGNNGFDWIYAVAPADVSREIGKLYTDQFLNPTSTPMLLIDRKGVAHPLPFGIKSADDLKKFIEPFLKEGM